MILKSHWKAHSDHSFSFFVKVIVVNIELNIMHKYPIMMSLGDLVRKVGFNLLWNT